MPETGIYVIPIGLAAMSNENPFVVLFINSATTVVGHYINNKKSNGVKQGSRTVIVSLNKHSALALKLIGGSVYDGAYSDAQGYQVNMKGMLYSPNRTRPVAWCVLWEACCNNGPNEEGRNETFKFNVVLVVEASGWNNTTNTYTVPLSGVYYVQITAGIVGHKPAKMELLLNGRPLIHVYRQFYVHNGTDIKDTRSNAIIVRLNANDELRVRLPTGYYLQTNVNRYTSFAGFRIYAL